MPQTRMAAISHIGQRDTSKGPIFQVTTTDGVEYSTFNGGLANQARQLVGRQVVLAFTEKHVNKDGRDYTNRYYEGAEPADNGFSNVPAGNAGEMTPLTFPTQPAQPDNKPESGREIRIMRQTASKVAAHMLVYLPENERTPDGLVAIAEYLVGYYENGARTTATADSYYDTIAPDNDLPF